MHPHPDRISWQNPRVLITLFTVFLVGAAFGGVLVKFGFRDVISRGAASWRPSDKVVLLLFPSLISCVGALRMSVTSDRGKLVRVPVTLLTEE